jgi:hypothetical protein
MLPFKHVTSSSPTKGFPFEETFVVIICSFDFPGFDS